MMKRLMVVLVFFVLGTVAGVVAQEPTGTPGIDFAWDEPSEADKAILAGWRFYVAETEAGPWEKITWIDFDPAVTAYEGTVPIVDLPTQKSAYFYLRAVSVYNVESDPSNVVTTKIKPTAPVLYRLNIEQPPPDMGG